MPALFLDYAEDYGGIEGRVFSDQVIKPEGPHYTTAALSAIRVYHTLSGLCSIQKGFCSEERAFKRNGWGSKPVASGAHLPLRTGVCAY